MSTQKDLGNCPKCGKLLDGHTLAADGGDAVPKEGDLSICFYCMAFLCLHDGKWWPATEAEALEIVKTPGIPRLIRGIREFQDKRRQQ